MLQTLHSLRKRTTESELMDDPRCDEEDLLATLSQFSSLNRFLARYRSILKKYVVEDMQSKNLLHATILDMGSGGGDINNWLVDFARKKKLDLRIIACDSDPRVCAFAQKQNRFLNQIDVRCVDLLEFTPEEPVDYVFANHFLHHLNDDEIELLMDKWHPFVRQKLIFSDLKRSIFSYYSYKVFSLMYRNSFVRHDGLISIKRGFTNKDLKKIADRSSGIKNSVIKSFFFGRLVLVFDGTFIE
jgi:hypothetical protein